MPRFLPYAVYRPLVRLAHYAGLRRALRSGEGVVVHDCGTQAWVRGWLAREARRRGGTLHLLLLDVTPGHGPGGPARARPRRLAVRLPAAPRARPRRLMRVGGAGRPAPGCGSAVLIDRDAADVLRRIGFDGLTRPRSADAALRLTPASWRDPHGQLAFRATAAVHSRR